MNFCHLKVIFIQFMCLKIVKRDFFQWVQDDPKEDFRKRKEEIIECKIYLL